MIDVQLEVDEVVIAYGNEVLRVNTEEMSVWTEEDVFRSECPYLFEFSKLSDGRFAFGTVDARNSEWKLYCVDRKGAKLWSAKLDELNQLSIANMDSVNSRVSVVSDDKYVAVFWSGSLAVKLDVFDIDTGSAVARFQR